MSVYKKWLFERCHECGQMALAKGNDFAAEDFREWLLHQNRIINCGWKHDYLNFLIRNRNAQNTTTNIANFTAVKAAGA